MLCLVVGWCSNGDLRFCLWFCIFGVWLVSVGLFVCDCWYLSFGRLAMLILYSSRNFVVGLGGFEILWFDSSGFSGCLIFGVGIIWFVSLALDVRCVVCVVGFVLRFWLRLVLCCFLVLVCLLCFVGIW